MAPMQVVKSAPRQSFFTRALSAIGLQRVNANAGRTRASVFRGASSDRLTADWFTRVLSADQELKGDLRRLRGTARAMVRDNSFATRYVNLLAENVIGPTGMRMRPLARNARGSLNIALNTKIKDAWRIWGHAENASVDGRMSFVDIEQLVIKSLAQDGEVIIRMIEGADNPFNFALQLIDPDQLDDQYSIIAGPTGNDIVMGVEIDVFGKPLKYHLWKSHPSDPKRGQQRISVPADQIIHLFVTKRVGQKRGVTWFAPVMFDQQMMQGYQEAEITAARIGASNMAAIEYNPEEGGDAGDDEEERESGEVPMEVSPGLFLKLGPGESLASTNFNHPNGAFGPFTKGISRSIATGLCVSYPSLSGDLEAVSFSSYKAGQNSERDFYRVLQAWLRGVFHRRVYQKWAPLAALGGYFSAADARGTERIDWQPRGWPMLEPLTDTQAGILGRRAGLVTLTQLAAERGLDWEENIEQIAEEDRIAAELGVEIVLDTSITASIRDASTDIAGDDSATSAPAKAPDPAEPSSTSSPTPITRRRQLAGVR